MYKTSIRTVTPLSYKYFYQSNKIYEQRIIKGFVIFSIIHKFQNNRKEICIIHSVGKVVVYKPS